MPALAPGPAGQWAGVRACNGGVETEGGRINRGRKEDARGMRDFFHDRGITVDTRMPER